MGALRILLVEDHAESREVLARLLRLNGHAVQEAAGARESLAAAARGSFDLLISDIGLPDGDGCDLLRELRRANPALRAVAVTGHAEDELSGACKAAGFSAFVRKPVSFSQLLLAVDAVAC